MTRHNLLVILSGLLILWGALLVTQLTAPAPPEVPLKFVGGKQSEAQAHHSQPTTDLAIPNLRKRSARPERYPTRNIFAPLVNPPPHILAKSTRSRPSKASRVANMKAATSSSPTTTSTISSPQPPEPHPEDLAIVLRRQQEESRLQEAKQQLAQYRLLGYMLQGESGEAFLSKGKDILIVRSGDTIDGHIFVASVLESGITLRHNASNLEITLRSGKNQGQSGSAPCAHPSSNLPLPPCT